MNDLLATQIDIVSLRIALLKLRAMFPNGLASEDAGQVDALSIESDGSAPTKLAQ